jgi:hypothetical protein
MVYINVVSIWYTFLYRQKSIKKNTQRKKLDFALSLLYAVETFGIWSHYKNSLSLDSFPLALAFVVLQEIEFELILRQLYIQ